MNSKLRRLLVIALLITISAPSTVTAFEGDKAAPMATAAEAALSFRDLTLLEKAYIDTAPAARDGTFPVGKLDVNEEDRSKIVELLEKIGEGLYGRYDSLLVAHKGKLVLESYFRRGRINLAHPQASATKGITSLILGRAIQMGYLTMADFDRPILDFLTEVDRSSLVEGVEKITLHKALTMHGGLSVSDEKWQEMEKNPTTIQGQRFVQTLLENSGPITDAAQVYKYGNHNSMLVMSVIDAVVPGGAENFIKNEFLGKLDITNFSWDKHASGLPQAGWMVSFTSRDMLKFGSLVLDDGKWHGEQLLPADYIEKVTSPLVKPTEDWMPYTYRYGYFWYHTPVTVGDRSHDATFAWGGGGQRIIVVGDLGLTIVITGHDGDDDKIMDQIAAVILPAFAK